MHTRLAPPLQHHPGHGHLHRPVHEQPGPVGMELRRRKLIDTPEPVAHIPCEWHVLCLAHGNEPFNRQQHNGENQLHHCRPAQRHDQRIVYDPEVQHNRIDEMDPAIQCDQCRLPRGRRRRGRRKQRDKMNLWDICRKTGWSKNKP